MQVIESVHEMQSLAVRLRHQGKLIGFVPTSGYLHAGHLSLIQLAQDQADVVVVSCFVNPKEFGANEDFARYPRDRERDLQFCREAKVDVVFLPKEEEIYPAGFSSSVTEDKRASGLCAISRPHYFKGVCTCHAKLFNIVRPDQAIYGRKDPQMAAAIAKMVEDLNFTVEIVVGPTVREPDGLACSARNTYLNEFQRRDARIVYQALMKGRELVDNGIRNVDRVLAEVTYHISQIRRLRVIYVHAVNKHTMEFERQIVPGQTLIITSVWCDEVRLLDNMEL
ncbi:MAG: pantoate--beta-alanine ligase [Verrucomicrobiota bacterium JB022]|nr:pantoate--beta-alanine ligase [Verrucomicrobiota bacterium JB022]